MIILNLPPALVRFGDQNKTRFSTGKHEINQIMMDSFDKRIRREFRRTECYKDIQDNIDEYVKDAQKKEIRKKKNKKRQPSHKYYPPSETRENLFIVEGGSAMGSILQKRHAKTDAVYSLKGKIKNARTLRDLGKNEEIIDIMSILGLDIDSTKSATFKNVIIATDRDPDGIGHIASLVINFFHKWFPHVITEKKLHILDLPLYTLDKGKKRNYFFTSSEYNAYRERWGGTNVRYLKGLGSLSFDDWEYVFGNMKVYTLRADARANHYLNVAFGKSAQLRKKWLESNER
jgi:topoisomerase-4 subunit B